MSDAVCPHNPPENDMAANRVPNNIFLFIVLIVIYVIDTFFATGVTNVINFPHFHPIRTKHLFAIIIKTSILPYR